jgi:hypothetical protein
MTVVKTLNEEKKNQLCQQSGKVELAQQPGLTDTNDSSTGGYIRAGT